MAFILRFSLSCTYNSARSCCFENRLNNPKSQSNLNFYILLSDKQHYRCWLQAIGWAQQRLRFCTPRKLINCMQRKCISAVLWQNPIKHESIIHPDVFNSFYRTVTHGEPHRIIYKEILLSMFTPFFSIYLPPYRNPPKTGTYAGTGTISTDHHPPPSPLSTKTTPIDTWTQSLITNFLSFNPPQYESKHHKQDLLTTTRATFPIACSMLSQLQNIKS